MSRIIGYSYTADMLPAGATVKFAAPVTAEESLLRFTIVEHRGARVLVELVDTDGHWRLVPTFVYPAADLIEA